MPPLPVISGLESIRALQRLGYTESRRRGSHVRLSCPGRLPVTVPDHETLDRGTLRSIIRAARLTVETFMGPGTEDPLELAANVYRGLRPEEIDDIERIALDRSHFFTSPHS